jgi:hypothetical protein
MTAYIIDWEVLVVAAGVFTFGGLVLGCVVGFIIGTFRSTSNKDGAWDDHETHARRIANTTQPAKFSG